MLKCNFYLWNDKFNCFRKDSWCSTMLETVVIYCKIFNLIKASWQEFVINYKNFGYIHLFLSFTWFVDRVWYFCWPLRRWFYPIIIKVCKKKKKDQIIHYLNCCSILYIRILKENYNKFQNKYVMYNSNKRLYIISFIVFFKFKDEREIPSLNGENDKTWSVFQLGNFEKWRQKEETFLEIAWRASLVCRIQCIPRATLLLKKFWAKRDGTLRVVDFCSCFSIVDGIHMDE